MSLIGSAREAVRAEECSREEADLLEKSIKKSKVDIMGLDAVSMSASRE